jgi:hypothetical protein
MANQHGNIIANNVLPVSNGALKKRFNMAGTPQRKNATTIRK